MTHSTINTKYRDHLTNKLVISEGTLHVEKTKALGKFEYFLLVAADRVT